MDMKLRGLYLARQLSFQGVTFRVEEVQLDEEFIRIYDESVRLWMECRRQFQVSTCDLVKRDTTICRMLFNTSPTTCVFRTRWSGRSSGPLTSGSSSICASAPRLAFTSCLEGSYADSQVNACVRIAMHAIAQNKCVVIGLQSTGESQTLQQLEDGEDLDDFVSTSKYVSWVLMFLYQDSLELFSKTSSKSISRLANGSSAVTFLMTSTGSWLGSMTTKDVAGKVCCWSRYSALTRLYIRNQLLV